MSIDAESPLPPLRQAVEAVEIEHEGKPLVLLRDQEGLTDQSIAVPIPAFLITMMLDGRNTAKDIQTAFSKATGSLIGTNEIESLVHQLDKAEFLETVSVQKKRLDVLNRFLQNPSRPLALSDRAYPSDKLELAAFLGKFFKDAKGPGKEMASSADTPPPLGLFSPHIDFSRGGPAYAWAYQALSESAPPDVVVALGVAHMSPNSPWVMTTKSYETPYGPLAVAEDLYDEFKKCLWYDPAEDEWAHRQEHSLEFQALWLKYLWRDKCPAWVPILCSSFDRFCPDRPPSSVSTVESAIVAIGDVLRDRVRRGQKILILGGVDLAHVGPRFGDEEKLGPELEARVEKEDRASLEHARLLDADAFYLSVVAGGHWRKVCGLSAMYTGLRWMKALRNGNAADGRLLAYGQAPDPLGGLVSFASMLFRG